MINKEELMTLTPLQRCKGLRTAVALSTASHCESCGVGAYLHEVFLFCANGLGRWTPYLKPTVWSWDFEAVTLQSFLTSHRQTQWIVTACVSASATVGYVACFTPQAKRVAPLPCQWVLNLKTLSLNGHCISVQVNWRCFPSQTHRAKTLGLSRVNQA